MVLFRRATGKDLQQIAMIHKEQFAGHYLSLFSPRFLEQFYCYLLDEHTVFEVAEEADEICGFVVGGDWGHLQEKLDLFVKENIFYCFCQIAIHPKSWAESCRKIFHKLIKSNNESETMDPQDKYTLLSIATSKNYQGKGIGSNLISRLEDQLRDLCHCYFLTVQEENTKAIQFYKKNGFTFVSSISGKTKLVKEIG